MKESGYTVKGYKVTVVLDMLACSNVLYLLAVKLQPTVGIWCLRQTCTSLPDGSRKALHKPFSLRMLANTP